MAAEKRPASNVFGTSQMVVKRQKSGANLGDRNAVTLANGSRANGALVQSVSNAHPRSTLTQGNGLIYGNRDARAGSKPP